MSTYLDNWNAFLAREGLTNVPEDLDEFERWASRRRLEDAEDLIERRRHYALKEVRAWLDLGVRENRALRASEQREYDRARADADRLEEIRLDLRGDHEAISEARRRIPSGFDHYERVRSYGELRGRALDANERAERLPDLARERVARALESDTDKQNRLATYVLELSAPAYYRAFTKYLRDPMAGPFEWSPEERAAWGRVQELRGMILGTGSAGGFLVPYELDPQILIAGTGAVDPMRAVSRVEVSAYNEKRFVTSLGVTASWDAEEAEVSDDTPTLVQPAIFAFKGAAFLPVSIELFEDSDIAEQVGALFADAKAQLEASAFTVGTGTGQPKGIITAVSAVGGSVITTGTNAQAIADPYNNQNALPARWRPRARFMANLSIINGFRQLAKGASVQDSLVDDSVSPPRMAGWEVIENSNMDGSLTAAQNDYALLSGDFQQYIIVDRVGTTIELVPHLFGAAGRPKGQRGFYLHWRTGGDVVIADAFRLTNYNT
jgi:HK97 family phage major capsid protein